MTGATWKEVQRGRVFPPRAPSAPPFFPKSQLGSDEGYRCGSCWHRVKAHWFQAQDPRFRDHPGTYWCQACGEFCLRAAIWTFQKAQGEAKMRKRHASPLSYTHRKPSEGIPTRPAPPQPL